MSIISKVADLAVAVVTTGVEKISQGLDSVMPDKDAASHEPAEASMPNAAPRSKAKPGQRQPATKETPAQVPAPHVFKVKRGQKHRHTGR